MVNDALRQIDTAQIKHDTRPEEYVIDVVPACHPDNHKWQSRHELDPTAELAKNDTWILRAEQAEAEVCKEVRVYHFLIRYEPGIALESLNVILLVDEETACEPAH